MLASEMPESTVEGLNKLFVINCLQVYMERDKLSRQALCSGNPLPFLKCANGTLLPLTLPGPSVRMRTRENFYHYT